MVWNRTVLLVFTVLGATGVRAQADSVVLLNGDRLTGEIRSLDRGLLAFKTDAIDTVQIRWDHVAELTSQVDFQIVLDDGRRLLSPLFAGAMPAELRLQTAIGDLNLPTVRVVRMTPIEASVIDRIDMGVDLGYSITKANDVAQANLGFDFAYRSEERLITLNVDSARSVSSDQIGSDQSGSTRANAGFAYRRFRSDRTWDPVGLAQLERNDELGLRRRSTAGGGMARWITDTNTRRVSFLGGLVYGAEDRVGVEGSEGSVEAVLGVNLDWFRYNDPEFDVTMRFAAFERLSGDSRTRGNLDVALSWELVEDFNWGFSVYYSFDSTPQTVDASTSDYGIVTSFGWDF